MSALPTNLVDQAVATTRSEPVGRLLMEAGALTREQVDQVVFAQRKAGMLFGEVAVSMGLISPRQIQQALLLQYSPFGIPGNDSGLDTSLTSALDPFSKQAEAIRDLRSQVTLRWLRNDKKSLAVIGVNSGAGCSTIAANLAISFAQLGERVVLVDANLRKPAQHKLFGIPHGVGLSSVLADRESVKNALVQVPNLPGLTVMPAGPVPPNPQELLSSVMFNYVLETLPATCDLMIVDTSALLSCADAQLVSAKIGGCILAVRRHHTAVADIAKAAGLLTPADVVVLGAVLND